MSFDFKLCKDPDINNRLRNTLSSTFSSLSPRIETFSPMAIILTGSLARGEGSTISNNGTLRLNSDLEALVVYENSNKSEYNISETKDLAEDITNHLKAQRVFCKVEFASISLGSFSRFKPTIFAYELKTMGKVIWGDNSVLSLIRPFSTHDIPEWDAFELVNNRIIEHLTAFQNVLNGRGCDVHQQEVAAYSLVKIYIDMATAILVFLGQYEPSYEARAIRFREVCHSLDDTPLRPYIPGLVDMVQRCTHFKIYQDGSALDFFTQEFYGGQSESSDDRSSYNRLLLKEWERLSFYVRPVWMWMANKIAGGDYTEDIYTLVGCILKQESFSNKLKGWARLCLGLNRANKLAELQYRRLLSGLTWGSPESIIRCLGALLYFYIHELRETESENDKSLSYIVQKMPYLSINFYHKIDHELLIKEINYNYRKFIRRDYGLNPSCCS